MLRAIIYIMGFVVVCWCQVTAQRPYQEILQMNDNDFRQTVKDVEAYYENRDKGKGSGYKQFKRWEQKMRGRLTPDGKVANYMGATMTEYTQLQARLRRQPANRQMNANWEDVSPTNYILDGAWMIGHGLVNCMAFHPTNANIIFIGTAEGGLWRSNNNGATWTCLTDGHPSIGVSGIAIHPDSPNIMYILTGDGDGTDSPSIGVLKSTNGGYTWNRTGFTCNELSSAPCYGYKIVMHPENPDILFVCWNGGIARSVDGANSWANVTSGIFVDIEFRPGDPDNMYATSFSAFYTSDDSGVTWELEDDLGLPNANFNRIAVAVAPTDPNRVYLLYGGGSTGFRGFYESTNSAQSFTLKSQAGNPPTSVQPNIMSSDPQGQATDHQASYDISLIVDPADEDVVYIGGVNIWRSANRGSSWSNLSSWNTNHAQPYVHGDIHNFVYRSDESLYACTDGGVWFTSNDGSSWTDINEGLNILQIYDFDIARNSSNNIRIICGTQDNGSSMWVIGQDGLVQLGADGFECHFDPSDTDVIYASTQGDRWSTSNDGGSWDIITPAPLVGSQPWTCPWILHTTQPDTFFHTFRTIFRQFKGGGTSYDEIDPGFDSTDVIVAMAQGFDDHHVMYISNGLEWRTTINIDAQPSNVLWANETAELPITPGTPVRSIIVDPSNAATLWVGFGGYVDSVKVMKSTDYAQSFTLVDKPGLPNIPVNTMLYDTESSQNGMYLGNDLGVYYTDDNLDSWVYFANGLPTVTIADLKLFEGKLYASTHGRGVWRTDAFTTCPAVVILSEANDPSNPYSTGVQVYNASSAIFSSRVISGNVGTNVTYRAGNYAQLLPGLTVTAGNLLQVEIGGCPN